MNIDFSSIRQDVINQVRAEYLQKEEEKVLKNATSVTPEVLVKLGSLVKETNLLQVLKDCKRRQDRKEKELFAQRQAIEAKFKKQKDAILTKEMLGVKVDPSELKKLEKEKDKKLHIMDLLVLKEMDKEVKYLQQEFVNLEVPLFRVTQDPKQLKLQQKILNMLQDML
ncbi:hypothetical protein BDF20DRAFT_824391 [Mycotypha africana]|uniref:uncharacterized protein n=1 Tax=Mycotypha africana TaxID=64632 RepID=UPI0022FFD156|nr:uncharacterized protein BDF20DRAFT_824391 [Mycotypha africana]KAI8973441.1 hypothetical protein BDF20DRAFT_824391 [Mycotypha africana]